MKNKLIVFIIDSYYIKLISITWKTWIFLINCFILYTNWSIKVIRVPILHILQRKYDYMNRILIYLRTTLLYNTNLLYNNDAITITAIKGMENIIFMNLYSFIKVYIIIIVMITNSLDFILFDIIYLWTCTFPTHLPIIYRYIFTYID